MLRERAWEAEKSARPTPKLHLLRHVPAFAARMQTWGGLSEQGMEAVHAKFNALVCIW